MANVTMKAKTLTRIFCRAALADNSFDACDGIRGLRTLFRHFTESLPLARRSHFTLKPFPIMKNSDTNTIAKAPQIRQYTAGAPIGRDQKYTAINRIWDQGDSNREKQIRFHNSEKEATVTMSVEAEKLQPVMEQVFEESQPGKLADQFIPVRAFYIARSLDVKGLVEGPLKMMPHHPARNNIIVRYPDRIYGVLGNTNKPGLDSKITSSERYVAAFQYGSVVFFNFDREDEDEVLDTMTKFGAGPFKIAHKDEYAVVLRPTLSGWSEGGQDHIMVKQLDTNNIRVISSILGQSVALDYYARKVDEMVNTFSELNRGMEQTGTFTMERKKLFQLVAAANTTLADVILRLGLLERSDTAWKHAQYAKIWEYMRDDFELDERFESLDFKLNIIQHNVRFFLDILQNRKSDTLEWIIILLIAGEICVSLYEIIQTATKTAGA